MVTEDLSNDKKAELLNEVSLSQRMGSSTQMEGLTPKKSLDNTLF